MKKNYGQHFVQGFKGELILFVLYWLYPQNTILISSLFIKYLLFVFMNMLLF